MTNIVWGERYEPDETSTPGHAAVRFGRKPGDHRHPTRVRCECGGIYNGVESFQRHQRAKKAKA